MRTALHPDIHRGMARAYLYTRPIAAIRHVRTRILDANGGAEPRPGGPMHECFRFLDFAELAWSDGRFLHALEAVDKASEMMSHDRMDLRELRAELAWLVGAS